MTSERPVPCLVGPTASGKSAVAVEAARLALGEVIACDALTVYRGVGILTAKPMAPDDVPHHLIDVAEPWESWSAGRFVEEADRLVDEVRARGRVPMLVGGTVLYLKSWLKGLGAGTARVPALRAELEEVARRLGPAALASRLASIDPVRAAQIHPHDVRRLVRAIEIAETSGHLASAVRNEWSAPDRRPASVVGLRRTREDTRQRISRRCAAMVKGGLVAEVAALDARARPPSPELGKALGLADVREHVAGRISIDECLARLERATWRFSRRQATFLKQIPATWVDVGRDDPPDVTARAVHQAWRTAGAVG